MGHGGWRPPQGGLERKWQVENTLCKKKKAKRGKIIFLVDFCFICVGVFIFTKSCELL